MSVHIKWNGIELDCKLEYERADPSVGYMSDQYDLLSAVTHTGDDIMDFLIQKAQDDILDKCISTVKVDAEEARAERQQAAMDARLERACARYERRMA